MFRKFNDLKNINMSNKVVSEKIYKSNLKLMSSIAKAEFNPTYTRGTDDSKYVTFDYLGEDGTNTGVFVGTGLFAGSATAAAAGAGVLAFLKKRKK